MQKIKKISQSELPYIKSRWQTNGKQNRMRFDTIRKQVLPFLARSTQSTHFRLKGFNERTLKQKSLNLKSHRRKQTDIPLNQPDYSQLKCKNQLSVLKQSHRKTNSSIHILQLINSISNNIHQQYNQTLKQSVQFFN